MAKFKSLPRPPVLVSRPLRVSIPQTKFLFPDTTEEVLEHITENIEETPSTSPQEHKYGCLMALIPEDKAREITDWVIENIPDFHLGKGGMEYHPHITIKYGFKTPDVVDRIRDFLAPYESFPVQLTKLSLFEGNEDGDVLKIEVESEKLRELNSHLTNTFECEDKYPTYRPHLTLAYLTPGVGQHYTKLTPPFLNSEVTISRLEWGGVDGGKEVIALVDPQPPMEGNPSTPSSHSHVSPPTVAIDFNETLVEDHPQGHKARLEEVELRKGAAEAVQKIKDKGVRIIIWTVRDDVEDVSDWLDERDVPHDYVNYSPDQSTTSPKVEADVYVDDKAVNARRPWNEILEILEDKLKDKILSYYKEKHLIVSGYSGAGKSTLARVLGERLGRPVHKVDQDDLWTSSRDLADHPDRYNRDTKEGRRFRKLLKKLVRRAIEKDSPHVLEGCQFLVSTGKLRGHDVVVVDADEDTIIRQRLKRDKEDGKLDRDGEEYRKKKALDLYHKLKPEVERLKSRPGVVVVTPHTMEEWARDYVNDHALREMTKAQVPEDLAHQLARERADFTLFGGGRSLEEIAYKFLNPLRPARSLRGLLKALGATPDPKKVPEGSESVPGASKPVPPTVPQTELKEPPKPPELPRVGNVPLEESEYPSPEPPEEPPVPEEPQVIPPAPGHYRPHTEHHRRLFRDSLSKTGNALSYNHMGVYDPHGAEVAGRLHPIAEMGEVSQEHMDHALGSIIQGARNLPNNRTVAEVLTPAKEFTNQYRRHLLGFEPGELVRDPKTGEVIQPPARNLGKEREELGVLSDIEKEMIAEGRAGPRLYTLALVDLVRALSQYIPVGPNYYTGHPPESGLRHMLGTTQNNAWDVVAIAEGRLENMEKAQAAGQTRKAKTAPPYPTALAEARDALDRLREYAAAQERGATDPTKSLNGYDTKTVPGGFTNHSTLKPPPKPKLPIQAASEGSSRFKPIPPPSKIRAPEDPKVEPVAQEESQPTVPVSRREQASEPVKEIEEPRAETSDSEPSPPEEEQVGSEISATRKSPFPEGSRERSLWENIITVLDYAKAGKISPLRIKDVLNQIWGPGSGDVSKAELDAIFGELKKNKLVPDWTTPSNVDSYISETLARPNYSPPPIKASTSTKAAPLQTAEVTGETVAKTGRNGGRVLTFKNGGRALFKAEEHEDRSLRPQIKGPYYIREAAAFEIAELLGLDDMVPPTTIRNFGDSRGSVQQYSEGSISAHLKTEDQRFDGSIDHARGAAFDFLIGNTDRHAGNWLLSPEGKLVLIDNGGAFPDTWKGGHTDSYLIERAAMEKLRIPPEVKMWAGRWGEMVGILKELGFSEREVKETKRRLDLLTSASSFRDLYKDIFG